ncbi:MAG TPA: thioredoxin-like domain-containing protein [Pyrinomonadaceae bacterium]|jgi:DNA-binding beta-propeller fold protein YncE
MKMTRVLLSAASVCLLLLSAAGGRAQGEKGGDGVTAREAGRQAGRVRAPELEGGRGWLNTDKPLSLAGLRGKVVLLDFWTYGCVNCMHVIPDLKRLEEKYPTELVIIGVHSAKFENEKETENIRRIVLRYGVEHPVVNDADFRIWNAYAVRAWPTQVLIDPAGYVVGQAAGEGNYDVIDRAVGELAADARRRGALDERPLKLALERARVGDLPLAFPGKVLADGRGDRLFVSDSNHNRVVVTRLDGTLLYTVGSGARGRADGDFARASFDGPQGLALDGETLYVADTRNHLVRRVDLKARTVETLAGTGEQLRDYRVELDSLPSVPLSSPWDLHVEGGTLYVAMAGPHQIWAVDLKTRRPRVFAGSGREARLDGARGEAAFAQPSGLAGDGRTLYVADSESNIIRGVGLGDAPALEEPKSAPPADHARGVSTLAGGDLFEFGDRDGVGDEVRLQHPLGLALEGGRLFVADTYNHKIKVLDPATRRVSTFVGTGKAGQADGERGQFYEPAGLSAARGRLYVADTNNHAVRVVDLSTRQTSTLVMRGLEPPQPEASAKEGDEAAEVAAGPDAEEFKPAAQRLGLGALGELFVEVALPAGHHLNPSAPHRYQVEVVGVKGTPARLALPTSPGQSPARPAGAAEAVKPSVKSKLKGLPLRVGLDPLSPGAAVLRVVLTVYYCREDNTGTCRVKTLVWLAPVEVTADPAAPRAIRLKGKVE